MRRFSRGFQRVQEAFDAVELLEIDAQAMGGLDFVNALQSSPRLWSRLFSSLERFETDEK